MRLPDDVLRRRTQRVGQQADRVRQRDVDLRARRGVGPPQQLADLLAVRKRRDPVLLQDSFHKPPVLLGDHRLELLQELVGLGDVGTRVRGRHHDVHAVGLAVDVLVDPRELLLELLRREPQRAEHAEPAGARHRRRHLLVHGEGVDRMLDPELVGQRRSDGHTVSLSELFSGAPSECRCCRGNAAA